VIFLVTDGEELGLLGAQAFVLQHPWAAGARRVVNLDARGTSGPAEMFETSDGNLDLVRDLARATPHVSATSLASEIYRLMPNDTDLTVFKAAGLRGLGFAFIGSPWNYHHPTDDAAHLDPGSLQQMGEASLGLVRTFASGDLAPGTGRSAVYFNPWGSAFVSYSQAWIPWLSILAVILTLAVLARDMAGRTVRARALLAALGILLLALGAAAGLGAAWALLLGPLHRLWGPGESRAFTFNPFYLLGSLGSGLVVVRLLARRHGKGDPEAFRAAALVAWTLLAVLVGLMLPGMSHLFHWPLLLTLGGLLFVPGRRASLLPGALAFLLLFAPLFPALALGLGFSAPLSALVALLLVLIASLMLPLLDRFVLTAAVLLGLAAILAGGIWSRAAFRGRAFTDLRYVRNVETGRAWWVAGRDHLGAWTRTFLDHPLPGNPSWLGDGTLHAASLASHLHQDAPLLPTPLPTLTLEGLERRDGLCLVHLAVDTAGAPEVWIRTEDPGLCMGTVSGVLLLSRPWARTGDEARLLQGTRPTGETLLALEGPPRSFKVDLAFTGVPGPVGLTARFDGLPPCPGRTTVPPPAVRPLRTGASTWIDRLWTAPRELRGPGGLPGSSHPSPFSSAR
jgi:hypothetical protein